MNAPASEPGTEPAAPLADEEDHPDCLLPPLGPVRKRLYKLAEQLSDVGCALQKTLIRMCRGLDPLPADFPARYGSISRAIIRANRAAGLAIALLTRIRAGIVVTERPAARPKALPKDGKPTRKRAPAAGPRPPRFEPDPVSRIEGMTDAEAFASIRRDLTLAAKALGLTEIVAQVADMAREAEALLARPQAAPLPPATRAEAEVQRRRAERAATAAAAAVAQGSSVVHAAAMPPVPPDSG
jgi:hypothetical protein